MSDSSASAALDARPIRPTAADTVWDRAVAYRDELAQEMRATLDGDRVDALVFASSAGNYPPWVKLEAWLPGPGGQERSELEIIVDTMAYRQHPLVVTARLTRGGRKIAAEKRPRFTKEHARSWTRYACRRERKPLGYSPTRDACVGLAATFLPFIPRPHRNRVAREHRNLVRLAPLAGLLALVLFFAGFVAVQINGLLGLGLILVGGLGLGLVTLVNRRRQHVVFVTPQPVSPPTNLGLVDSWHTVIADLGRDYAEVKGRLIETLKQEEIVGGLTCRLETYGYRTPNGFEERERLVVSKGQGVVHVHIYSFGEDVFIGWHAYLNWAKWDETTPVSTKIVRREAIEYRELRRGFYIPSQFDLIDLNSLSELVHRRLQREIKAILKEKAIDQDIDFKIIRGDRDAALDQARHGEKKSGGGWRYKSQRAS